MRSARLVGTARTVGPARLSHLRALLLWPLLGALTAPSCRCGDDLGAVTQGLTLLDPAGRADEFERTLDLGAVRVGTLRVYNIRFKNTGKIPVNVTRAVMTNESPDLVLNTGVLPNVNIDEEWTLALRYFPTDMGADTATIVVETDSVETPKYTITVTGRGASPVVDACSPNASNQEVCASQQETGVLVVDVGSIAPEGTLRKALKVRNRGDVDMTVLRIEPSDLTSSEYVLEGTRPATIPAGGVSELVIAYTPLDGGLDEGVIEVVTDDPVNPRMQVLLRANGLAPRVCVRPGVLLDFGPVDVGGHKDLTLTLESCGAETVTINSATAFDSNGVFTIPNPPTFGALAPGQTVDVVVRYSPTAFRDDDGVVNVSSTDPATPLGRIRLLGKGVGCELVPAPTSVSFGQVSTSGRNTRQVQVRNQGTGTCTVTGYRTSGAPFTIERSNTVPEEVPAGGVTTFAVAFAPTAAGARSGQAFIDSNGATITIPLNGTGISPPPCDLQANPTTLVYTGVATGQVVTQNVALTNYGTADCYLKSGTFQPGSSNAYSASVSGFPPASIGPGATTQLPIKFQPTTAGRHQGVFRIIFSADSFPAIPIPGFPGPAGTNLDINLDGTTLSPKLCLSPADVLDFGVVAPPNDREMTLTLSSCGEGPLQLRGVLMAVGTTREFSFPARPTVPVYVPAGQSIAVKVKYKPTANGPDAGAIEVLSNDPAGARQVVRLRANAAAVCDNELLCSVDKVLFPTTEIGRSTSVSVTCMNAGTQPAQVTGARFPAPTSAEFRHALGRRLPITVAAGRALRFEVTYTPQDAGIDTGTIEVQGNMCKPLTLALEATGRTPSYPRCPPPQVFQPQTLWEWSGGSISSNSKNVGMSPVVINLTDDNRDGRIDETDVPDVIFTTCQSGECCINCTAIGGEDAMKKMDLSGKGMLRAVRGENGTDLWAANDPSIRLTATSQIAAGDLDGDNIPEIVAVKHHFREGSGSTGMEGKYAIGTLLVFDNAGKVLFETEQWTGETSSVEQGGAPTLGDLDGDGMVEIFFERTIFDASGVKVRDLATSGNDGHGSFATLSDLDDDGALEIVSGNYAYRNDGTQYWKAGNNLAAGPTMVLDVDKDGNSDVILRDTPYTLSVLDGKTGVRRAGPFQWPRTQGTDGEESICSAAMASADLTGDGKPDFIVPAGGHLMAIKSDGTTLWDAPIDDYGGQCGASGAAAFDFEGDGRYEVVYHDTSHLYAFRSDGTKIYDAPRNSSTLFETPVIADVNNDGHADLVMTNENGILGIGSGAGVRVVSNTGNTWPATRRVWNQHSYHQSDVNENGSIPRAEVPSWKTNNNWRAQPPLCRP